MFVPAIGDLPPVNGKKISKINYLFVRENLKINSLRVML